MKPCVVFIVLLFCCPVFSVLCAETAPRSSIDPDWMMELELGLVPTFPQDVHSGDYWERRTGGHFGLTYTRPINRKLLVRGTLSYEMLYMHWLKYHPFPYMMAMDAKIHTYSAKLYAGADYALHRPKDDKAYFYVNAGMYAEHVFKFDAEKCINYVSGNEYYDIDMNDSYPTIMPGVQVGLGLRGAKNRLELSHWQDIKTFTMPGIPAGKQRRVGFGITWAHSIHKKYPAGYWLIF